MSEILLVVDVQNDVMVNTWHKEEVIQTIQSLVKRARENQIPVFWVQHNDDYLVVDTEGWQIVPELVPLLDEVRIRKEWGDSFVQTPLISELEKRNATSIVLVGAQSDFCIRMTMYGAVQRG